MSPDDTEDVIQETLLELFQKINDYRAYPNKRFRAWLRKVAYYQYLRILTNNLKQASSNTISDGKVGDHGESRHTQPAVVCQSFLQMIDLIADQELIEIACKRVAGRISCENWTIFQRKELEGTPGKIVAEEFGITTNSVDVITFRVRRMIRTELKLLDPEN